MRVYYDRDADVNLIKGKKVAIVGYGSQGHAHTLNLRDSGVKDVAVALRPGSATVKKAEGEKLKVLSPSEAAKWADVVMILAPDELQADIYTNELKDNLRPGSALAFAHGLNVQLQADRAAPRHRRVHDRAEGPRPHGAQRIPSAAAACLAWWPWRRTRRATRSKSRSPMPRPSAAAVRASSRPISRKSARPDLFGEQAVLCGGLTHLIQAGFETLVEAGYAPEMAYFECLHEVKLIVDLIYEGGMANMRYSISNTAEYGDYTSGPRIVTDETKAEMKRILTDIQSGRFTSKWITECKSGQPSFKAMRRNYAAHPIEEIGVKLRGMMPWIAKNKLVDKAKN